MYREGAKRLLGTELPIIQAPMAGVQDSELAIAVCRAGGLGSIPCGMLTIDQIVNETQRIREATTQPYNLNFFCHSMPAYNEHSHARWQACLAPYFDEVDEQCVPNPNGASRMPFNHDIADAIESLKPPIISFHFGLPDKALLARVKRWGTKVISSATTVEEACWLEANGADAIIAQGSEAGGHRGMFLSNDLSAQSPMNALLACLVESVSIPVIAAGGIGNHDDVQRALASGAGAVQVGTSYMLCSEAKTSSLHRDAIKGASEADTAITNIFSGRPARGIMNRAMTELGCINELAPAFPYSSIEMGQLRSHFEKMGKRDFSPLWSGQNTSGCKEVSAETLTRELAGIR
ncbi:2-nitropropane dioxygenase [Enterovibrio norvegicus]|uniref:NAD(P)H-dependent flavin oxidoreductase n=1 Tax=Enterovibrio norvegicus TaxID=188144 RepID=UPI000C83E6C8|nr:nitronate monooxygenase [Enterovibrio norvegicus]MCC4797124.1 nitronate monooxygenase [Enterovibrio norvegicus]PMI40849.1 2-nitropropane dioxygenase [Enterovibrio norvegicus]PMN56263.1 2-nitropropane dioxygenase [Enterovibrio norvegicus]